MNAPVKSNLPAKVPVHAGGQVAALIPQSLEEAFRVANAIAASGLAPRGVDKPEQVLVAIMAGAELGMAPYQSLQSFAVINGRPAIWGDGLMAVVRSNGFKVREWFEGTGDDLIARCEVTRPDNGEVTPGEFSIADAKKAGLWGKQGPWQQYPKRMLKMRARAFALRDGAADVLRGFQVREEVEDYQAREVRQPEGTGMRARLEGRQAVGGFDPSHIETELAEVQDADFSEAAHVATEADAQPPADPPDDAAPSTADLGLKTGAQLLAEQATSSEAGQGGGVANNGPADGQPDLLAGAAPKSGPPLAERVNAVKAAMAKAAEQASLDAIWNRAAALRRELEAKDPEGLLVDLQDAYDAMTRMLEAARG